MCNHCYTIGTSYGIILSKTEKRYAKNCYCVCDKKSVRQKVLTNPDDVNESYKILMCTKCEHGVQTVSLKNGKMNENQYREFKRFVGGFAEEKELVKNEVDKIKSSFSNGKKECKYVILIDIGKKVDKEIQKINGLIENIKPKSKIDLNLLEEEDIQRIKGMKSGIAILRKKMKNPKQQKSDLSIWDDEIRIANLEKENESAIQKLKKSEADLENRIKSYRTEKSRIGYKLKEDNEKFNVYQVLGLKNRLEDLGRELDREEEALDEAQADYDYKLERYENPEHPLQIKLENIISSKKNRISNLESEITELNKQIDYHKDRLSERQKQEMNVKKSELPKIIYELEKQMADIRQKSMAHQKEIKNEIESLQIEVDNAKPIKIEKIRNMVKMMDVMENIFDTHLKAHQKAVPRFKANLLAELESKPDKKVIDVAKILWKKATL